jgi:queuine tRNA-ribosyltransferase
MEIQRKLGADICMAFDECIPYPAEHGYARQSVERTLRWAKRCLACPLDAHQLLFGIIQGGVYQDLREHSARATAAMPFHGLAIGGVSVGEGLDNLKQVVDFTERHMPEERARYLMGVGLPEDILASVDRGMDMFDCVIPTRYARGGTLFTVRGRIRIEHNRYRRDAYPIDRSCDCHACAHFTRAYIRHLFLGKELLGTMLATIHNLRFYQDLMADMRRAIEQGRFSSFALEWLARHSGGRKVER